MSASQELLICIKGAGDLASGVAWRLHRCGFPVVMTELAAPLAVRRSVSFAEAVYRGSHTVEGVTADRVTVTEVMSVLQNGRIPVLIDPTAAAIGALAPAVVIDGIMAKRNTGLRPDDAPLVIALGPGFVVGGDCHAVIETRRGHRLGRALFTGSAEPDTGLPGPVSGVGWQDSRVLRAPIGGTVWGHVAIGEAVQLGDRIATVCGPAGEAAVHAAFAGRLRGLIHPSVTVTPGMKIGDLDPRPDPDHCHTISDKSLAIAGGVLEAILYLRRARD